MDAIERTRLKGLTWVTVCERDGPVPDGSTPAGHSVNRVHSRSDLSATKPHARHEKWQRRRAKQRLHRARIATANGDPMELETGGYPLSDGH